MPPKSFKPTRERKQRRLVKSHSENDPNVNTDGSLVEAADAPFNTNVEIMIPLTAAQKADKRRLQLKEELKAGLPKMSAKKAKRFNKYIESKLKKEEAVAIMEKLAETKVDTSLFTSTRSIGASRESKKQAIKRALLEEQAGINMEANKQILYEERRVVGMEDYKGEMQDKIMTDQPAKIESVSWAQARTIAEPAANPFAIGATFGTGLKRPLDGEDGPPVIKRIKKNRKPRKVPVIVSDSEHSSDEEMPTSDEESEEGGSGDEGGSDEEEWGGISEDEDAEGSDDSEGSDGSGSSEDESEEEPVERVKPGQSGKANAFKEWALAQRRATDGETGVIKSNIEASMELKSTIVHIPRSREEDMMPLPEELVVVNTDRKVHYVTVPRTEEIQAGRLLLPVVAEEQRIMEAIHSNSVVVICGETGSGKTTQVPQFLYEAGYGTPGSSTPGLIGVTQPRRVAAVSMASRVGTELGPGGKEKVAYQIRFDGTTGPNTAIKFMTDGVLLRELSEDFLLRKYSAVIIDEAHERSINTDILIGVMSRVVRLRETMSKKDGGETKPLKLIIMSATLRVSDFVENLTLFSKPPPLLKVEARQHPVTVHFSRRTNSDYVEEAFKKVCRINRRLPPGGILVFLTGQNEILTLLKKLKNTFPQKTKQVARRPEKVSESRVKVLASEAIVEAEDVELGEDDEHIINNGEEDPISDDEDQDLGEEMGEVDVEHPLHVLPLYSLLPTKDQLKVFEDAPEGTRLVVLATNVAETSLTIPGISYVVDCGRSKERNYDKVTGVQSFNIQWTSKASASQRAGRAGRTGPGHCYRLYSSAVYETDFEKFAKPELLRMPIEGVVLQMKSMNIDTITNFPFPTPPDRESLHNAEKLLGYLRAIGTDGALTELGKTMNFFPLSPRFAKILMIGQQHGCLPYIIAVVSALSVGDVFIPEQQLGFNEEEEEDMGHRVPTYERNALRDSKSRMRSDYYRAHANFSALDPESDAIKMLAVVCAFEYEKHPAEFCSRSFIRLKAMEETRKLRQQISNIVKANCPGVLPKFEAKLPPPSKLQVKAIKQIVAAGFIDNVAIRADLLPNSDFKLNNIKMASQIPYVTLFPSSAQPSAEIEDRSAFLHQSSVLVSNNVKPEYVIYSELTQSSTGSGKVWMKPLTTIKGGQLATLSEGTPLITYSKPLESKPPRVLPDSDGKRREVWVVPRVGAAIGKSGLGWSLPPQKIIQKREGLSQKWVKE